MSKEVLDQAISQGNATLAAWDTLLEELASIKGPNGEEFDLNLVV